MGPVVVDWHLWWLASLQSRAGHNHAGGDYMQRIEKAGVNELNEAREVGATARITDVIFVNNITSGSSQCNARQITYELWNESREEPENAILTRNFFNR